VIEAVLGAAGMAGSAFAAIWTRNAHLEKQMMQGFESVKDQILRSDMATQAREQRMEGRLDLHEYRIDRLERGAARQFREDDDTDESLY